MKELAAAGFSEAEAEAVASVVRRTREIDISDLATRGDLAVLRSDIGALRSDLKADLGEFKADILKRVVGAIGLQAVAIIGAVTVLLRLLRP